MVAVPLSCLLSGVFLQCVKDTCKNHNTHTHTPMHTSTRTTCNTHNKHNSKQTTQPKHNPHTALRIAVLFCVCVSFVCWVLFLSLLVVGPMGLLLVCCVVEYHNDLTAWSSIAGIQPRNGSFQQRTSDAAKFDTAGHWEKKMVQGFPVLSASCN